jgi:hypothetical protein
MAIFEIVAAEQPRWSPKKGTCFEPLRLPGEPDEPQCVVKSGAYA